MSLGQYTLTPTPKDLPDPPCHEVRPLVTPLCGTTLTTDMSSGPYLLQKRQKTEKGKLPDQRLLVLGEKTRQARHGVRGCGDTPPGGKLLGTTFAKPSETLIK